MKNYDNEHTWIGANVSNTIKLLYKTPYLILN